jgi:hypothetical protein
MVFFSLQSDDVSMMGASHDGSTLQITDGGGGDSVPGGIGPKVTLPELLSLTRHSKFNYLKDALDYLPDKVFDKALVQVPFIENQGTLYTDGYENLPFHINKADEHGNTMLCLAAQNGNKKITQYLVQKGANMNHQNKNGQTAGHFANAYSFFDLSQWLFANGADDQLTNSYGLSPYDGLQP